MMRIILVALGTIAGAALLAGSALAAAPRNTAPPTVTGKLGVGQTLTANNGSWSGGPTTYAYQWQRCSREGSDCGNIAGRTAKTYRLTDADVGNTVRVVVTAGNADGSSSASSKPTESISGDAAPRVVREAHDLGQAGGR